MSKSIVAPKKKKAKEEQRHIKDQQRIRDICGQTHTPAFSSFVKVMPLMLLPVGQVSEFFLPGQKNRKKASIVNKCSET